MNDDSEIHMTRSSSDDFSEELERISHALNDRVIKKLFTCGLMMQSAQTRLRHQESAVSIKNVIDELIKNVTDELDKVIHEIRSVIFEMAIASGNETEGGGPGTE